MYQMKGASKLMKGDLPLRVSHVKESPAALTSYGLLKAAVTVEIVLGNNRFDLVLLNNIVRNSTILISHTAQGN